MKLASRTNCTACMACVDSCSQNALKVEIDNEGFYSININQGRCVECGLCSKRCPVLNPPVIDKNAIELSTPYAAWCTESELRTLSASGGAFAGIAKEFIERGAVVYGAVISGFQVNHTRIETMKDLPLLLGSKYQHSRLDDVYRQIRKDLRSGRIVLFSGLSCQTSAVYNYIDCNLRKNLYLIDTICGGLTTLLPIIQLKNSNKYSGIHSYRNKDNGWRSKGFKYALKLIQIDGQIVDLGMDNVLMQSFCHKEIKRLSCMNCKFNGFHRVSDATIGDFWGDTRYVAQHQNGLSSLIIHSNRIQEYIKPSSLHLEPVGWNDLIECNPNIYWSHYPILSRSLTRKRVFRSLLSGNDREVKRLLRESIIKRLESYVFMQYNEHKRKLYLKRIFNK